ncbi:MAG: HlyC/CorC family transporter, partial [Deferribacterales bacterium]|nr:HlyC/CorC family transporter [Deferribacterales bacterium]
MDTQILQSLLMILLAFFLVFLNGFFVLSEFAIVKVRRSRLEELVKNGKSNAKLALAISGKLDSYLSATQLGITLSSLALGWIGEPAVARLLEKPFSKLFGDNTVLIHSVSFVIAFTFITLLHVVAGELIPKSIAIARSEKASLAVARPLHGFWILFYPLIKLFDKLSAFFLARMGIKPASESETAHSEEELKFIAEESLKGGFIDSVEEEIIKNAVDFSDTTAKEIMTPRRDIICLKAENSYEGNLQIIRDTRHTRYPYCKGGKDMIVGMIHIRDILENELSQTPSHDLTHLVRQMIIVPEMASISDILAKMNRRQIHTALVIDEYGGTAGLLTMEDIIEEVMGDISDEHDLKIEEYKKLDDNSYVFDGMTD